jgi:RNA polymerase sigma factor (sigma-70 family)
MNNYFGKRDTLALSQPGERSTAMTDHSSLHQQDLALIERLVAGEDEAADQLFALFGKQFRSHLRGQRLLRQDREELAQEAICKTVDQLLRGQYRGESSLATWLGHIIRGTLVDHFRTIRRIPQTVPPPSPSVEETSFAHPLAPDPPTALIGRPSREDSLTVREVLAQLSPVPRQILLLKHIEGWTIREIAQRLGMTEGQVISKLYPAQEKFRRLFGSR